ncbi:MAG: PIN domain-containing protein [Planctomycetaceae bacterium]|nr:PIN domain-containing protein [Planctomycetaceae bacterium]
MTDKVFIDSNVWVYLFSDNKNHKAKAAERFLDDAVKSVFVTSCQVVNEVCNVLKRHGLAEDKIRTVIESITNICLMQDISKEVCLLASALREQHSLSFWDSVIVATAKTSGCCLLISEDMHDGLAVDTLRIKNIFS